jgi:hypothetical protein
VGAGIIENARLVGSQGSSQGMLQVFVNGSFSSVCRDGVTNAAADTACRMLGFPMGGYISSCPDCSDPAPLAVGSLVCGQNDTILGECGYVALADDGGDQGGLLNGWGKAGPDGGGTTAAGSAAFCRRYNAALGLNPALAITCRSGNWGYGERRLGRPSNRS